MVILAAIIRRAEEAQAAYGSRLGVRLSPDSAPSQVCQTLLAGLAASASDESPAPGPRGGKRWSPRYFARRDAWHILDHPW